MRLLCPERPTQEPQGVHVLFEPAQAEQKGPAIEGFDGRVVGLNSRPVDAAAVRRLHAYRLVGRAARSGRERRSLPSSGRRIHSSGLPLVQ